MKSEQLYFSFISPYLKDLKSCTIYKHELKIINDIIIKNSKYSSLYKALDIPDFSTFRNLIVFSEIIKLSCNKFKMGSEINYVKEGDTHFLLIDGLKYQLIYFFKGEVPIVNIKFPNLVFFMIEQGLGKVFYCGKLSINKLELDTLFKSKNFAPNTDYFINFKTLNTVIPLH